MIEQGLTDTLLARRKAELHGERVERLLRRKEAKWPARGFQVETFNLLNVGETLGVLCGLRKKNGTLLGQHRFYFSNPPLGADPESTWREMLTEAIFDRYERAGLPLDPDDPDPTLTAYGITADGAAYSAGSTYSTVRSGAAGVAIDGNGGPTATTDYIGQDLGNLVGAGVYWCGEGFFGWDTSSIGSGQTITAATASWYMVADYSTTDFTMNVYARDWGGTLETGDWVAGADLSGLTLVASKATSGIGSAGLKAWTSEAAFLTSVNPTGSTYVLMASSRHAAGTTPTGIELLQLQMADYSGTTQDPKLVVDYTEAAAGISIPVAMHYYRQQ